ncbi:hypothetical protein [Piscirickettsia litoralis]|uniref:hypothetical protein n=1 Tax=Piscirickettsia litoralis TaxID=1891921 RepID=UPI0013018158|nr:hypothetical protein [Piscirickettsia litoralis]
MKKLIVLLSVAVSLSTASVVSFAADNSSKDQSIDQPQLYATEYQYQWMNEQGPYYGN